MDRVIWSEGMFLRPQHFQQEGGAFEHYLESRTRSIQPYYWGFAQLELDLDLLPLGKLGIKQAKGLMPDGQPFSIPDHEGSPEALTVPTELRDSVIWLLLPVSQPGKVPFGSHQDPGDQPRYVGKMLTTKDNTRYTEDSVSIEVARLNLKLMSDKQSHDGYVGLPLCKVREVTKEGSVKLDKEFIPTLLHALSDRRMLSWFSRLQGMLHQRAQALSKRFGEGGSGATTADMFYLRCLNLSTVTLNHLQTAPLVHPEDLYRHLTGLMAELSTVLDAEHLPPDMPSYSHNQPELCFQSIYDMLQALIAEDTEHKAVRLTLKAKQYGYYISPITDRTLITHAQLYLAVKADMPEENVRRLIPINGKMGPIEQIRDLVSLQLPGIAVLPVTNVPREIPFHKGYVYFQLQKKGEWWDKLDDSAALALHVGSEIADPTFELWAVMD